MRKTLLLLMLAMAPARALAGSEDWHFTLSAASDKLLRGLDLSNGHPYVEAAASWYAGPGPFADVSVSSFALLGHDRSSGAQLVADAGYSWRLDSAWSAQVMVAHYQSWNTPTPQHMNYQELALSMGWRDTVVASVAVSPHATIGPLQPAYTLAYDLVGRLPLRHGLTATAGVGYYDLHAAAGTGYGYGSVGLSYQRGPMQIDFKYVATVGAAKAHLNGALDNRWVGQLMWHF